MFGIDLSTSEIRLEKVDNSGFTEGEKLTMEAMKGVKKLVDTVKGYKE